MTSAADPFAEFAVDEPPKDQAPAQQADDPFAEFAVAEPAQAQRPIDFAGTRPRLELDVPDERNQGVGLDEEVERWKDDRARSWFEYAQSRNPARELQAFDLAKASGAPIDLVRERLDDIRASQGSANTDIRQWRQDNPDLELLLAQHPQMGPVVTKDQTRWKILAQPDHGLLSDKFVEDHPVLSSLLIPHPAPSELWLDNLVGEPALAKETHPVEMQDLSHLAWYEAPVDALKRAAKQNWIAKEGYGLALDDALGNTDQARLRQEAILRQQQALGAPATYGKGIKGALATIADAAGGQLDSTGALLTGVGATAITKRPEIGAAVAKLVGATTSYVTETGGAYLDFADTSDDDGNPVDKRIAFAAAHMYGILAAAVEVGALNVEAKGIDALDAKRWFKSALTDKTKRGIFLDATKQLVKNAAAEGGEEASQETMQIAFGYLTKLLSAGKLQEFDKDAAEKQVLEATGQGVIGSLLPGAAGFLSNTATQFRDLGRSQSAGAQLAAINEVAKTDAAQAAPRQVAAFIASQQQSDGRKVTHVYVDPKRLVEEATKGGARPEDVATELMGQDGPRRLQDALDVHGDAPGARATLEVPLDEYLGKWGGKPIADALAEDISTGPGLQTMREVRLFQSDVQAQVDALASGESVEGATPQETAMVGTIEQQLVAAGRPQREARHAAAVVHAMATTLARQSGRTTEEVLAEMPSVAGVTAAAGNTGNESLNQPALESMQPNLQPASAATLREDFAALSPEDQQQRYFRDRNTGLQNFRAFETSFQDQANQHLAMFSLEGSKFLNDNFGHGSVDGALRQMADAVRSVSPDGGAKIGGDIGVFVKDDAHAQQILEAMKATLPKEVQVTYDIGKRHDTLKKTIDEVHKSHKAKRLAAVKANKLGGRSGAPMAFLGGERRLKTEDGMVGIAPESTAGKKILERAAKRAGPVAEALTATAEPTTPTPLADTHKQVFANDKTTFETAHLDASGLLNDDGFAQARANPKTRKKFVMSADLRGFGKMNDAFGHEGTDAIKAFFNQRMFNLEAGQWDTANLHGDEYAAQGNDEAAMDRYFSTAQKMLQRAVLWEQNEDGSFSLQLGLHFAYGIDADFDTADRVKLKAAKDKQGDVSNVERVSSIEDLEGRISAHAKALGVDKLERTRVRDLVRDGVQEGTRSVGQADQVANRAIDALSAVGWPGAKTERLDQPAFHGTPHRGITKFSLDKIGSGEGHQAYGWGLYFASNREVGESYRRALGNQAAVVTVDGQPIDLLRGGPDGRGALPENRARRRLAISGKEFWDLYKRNPSPAEVVALARNDLIAHRENIGAQTSDGKRVQEVLDALDKLVATHDIAVRSPTAGQLHKVDIPENGELLDYDKVIAQQPSSVIEKLTAAGIAPEDRTETGRQFYKQLSRAHGGDQAASGVLLRAGIPGLRYLDGNSRSSGDGSHNFVIWSEDAIRMLETLYQPDGNSPRGWIDIVRDGVKSQYKIFLTKKADASTFLHESAHAYLEMLTDAAAVPDAAESLKSDFTKVRKWVGAKDGEAFTVEQKEQFARGFEAYLLEGRAPSSALAEAFASFRRWLTEIYKSIASLGVELNDDIRGVFDRMLATDQEIDRARNAAGLSKPVFSTPEQAGVAPKDFDAYLAAQERVRSDVITRTQRLIHEGELRAAKAFKTEGFKKFKDQFSKEWDQLPQVRAWRYVRLGEVVLPDETIDRNTGRGKLDRDEVISLVGKDSPLIKKLTGRLVKGGESPIDVADRFGYSAKDMLDALAQLPDKDTWVRSEAERAMEERHPEIEGDIADLQKKIQELLHEDSYDQAERDWQLIKARTHDPVTVEALKRSAKEKVANQVVGRIDPGVVLNRERTFATQMAQAVAEGNFERAMAFAHRRLLHKYMWRELVAARDMRDRFYDLASDMLSDKRRAQLGKAAPEYRDVTDSLLEAVQATPVRESDERRRGLGELLARMDADGNSVAFDEDFIGKLLDKPTSWREMKVSELQQVLDALQNIKASARNMTTALQEGKRIDREKWVADLVQSAEANVKRTRTLSSSAQAESFVQKAIAVGEAYDGMNLRPEAMLEWLGGDHIDSPWHALVKMLQDAKHKQSDLMAKTAKPVSGLFDKIPKGVRRRLRERIDGRALFPNHRKDLAPPSRRFELLMLALNAGNESNLERLLEGRGISYSELHAALSLLTKEELDWVQSVWDQIESLWSSVRELEERDTGLAPPKIAPVPLRITSSDGKQMSLRGGYFPAVYDGRVSGAGERADIRNAADALDISLTRPSTNRSHTKGRADKFADVISLNPATIQSHLVRVTHDIAYREAIRSAASIVLNPSIKRVLREKLGAERAKVFEPWLRDIGRLEAAQAESHGGAFTQALRYFRSNVPVAVLGHAIDNYLGDTTGLLTAVIGSGLSKRHYAAGLAQFAKSAKASREFALAKSGELRSRGDDTYQGFQRRVKSLAQGRVAQIEGVIKEHAFFFAEQLEKAVVTPVWLGAYRQAQAQGLADEKAVDFADSLVRRSFPSKNVVDKSAIQRDKGMLGFMSMFVGYANWAYNQYRRIWQPVLAAEGLGDTTLAATMAMAKHLALAAVIGPVAELLVGHGPEPDEEWEQWLMRKMLVAHLLPLPLIGGFAEEKLVGHASNRTNPGLAAAESIWRAFQKAADDGAEPMDVLYESLKAYGYVRGIPAVRPIRWLQYLLEGDHDNDGGIPSGLLYGNREGQPTNLINLMDR